MPKIIYFSDSHFRVRRPLRRLDEAFFDNQLKKLDEVIDLCIYDKCDALIHGGDLFDVALPDYGIFNAVAKRFYKLSKAKIPAYITFGSHDMIGYRIDSIDKTGVGALLHSGLINGLVGPQAISNILFYGVPALLHHTVEVYKKIPSNNIIITHNIVTSDELPFDHISFKDLDFSDTRIFLCAHYHKFFKVQSGNSFFFSTGPLVRTDKTENEHEPNLLYINIDATKATFDTKIVSHIKDVMDMTEKTELGTTCISGLKETRINFFNIFELTKRIAKENNVGQDILDVALQRLEQSQRGMADVKS